MTEVVGFTPFLLLADPALVTGAAGVLSVDHLDGAGELAWLARFASWSEALAARDGCRNKTGLAPDLPAAPYRFFPDAVQQYLRASRTPTARCLAEKAVVVLQPGEARGTVLWPMQW